MSNSLHIMRFELGRLLHSPVLYLVLAFFLGLNGYFFWLGGQTNVFLMHQADMSLFFSASYWLLYLLVPVLCMRSLAGERSRGTLELLLTRGISPAQLIAGKFTAILLAALMALLLSLPWYYSLSQLGPVDHSTALTAYLGLILLTAIWTAIGLWASSLTKNQLAAYLLSIGTGLFFQWLFGYMARSMPRQSGDIPALLGLSAHFQLFARGLAVSSSFIFMLSLIALGLMGAAFNLDRLRTKGSPPLWRNKLKQKRALYMSFITGIVIMLNIIAHFFPLRADWTSDQRHSLTAASISTLQELERPVSIKLYLSGDLPRALEKEKKEWTALLDEYQRLAGDKLHYSIRQTEDEGQAKTEAEGLGIYPIQVSITEDDREVNKKVYFGAVVQSGKKKTILPFLPGEGHPEHALTRSISGISRINKPAIGILQGHGEANLADLQSLVQELKAFYRVLPVSAAPGTDWSAYEAILLLRPEDSIPPAHLAHMQSYLRQGGKMLIATDRYDADMQNMYAKENRTGLTAWLEKLGIRMGPGVVISPRCGTMHMRQPGSNYTTPAPFPYAPVLSRFATHPATVGIELMLMNIVSPLSYEGTEETQSTCLIETGTQATIEAMPGRLKPDALHYDKKNKSCVALALHGPIGGGEDTKMIVVGDGDFCLTNLQQAGSERLQDNVWFLANATDWLCGKEEMNHLRTRKTTARPLTELGKEQRHFIKWANFSIPLFLILIIGTIIYTLKLTRRKIIYKKYHAKDQ